MGNLVSDMEQRRQSWGLHLREARESANLSRNEVAEKVGVRWKTIQRWEQGLVEPYEENLCQLRLLLPALRLPDELTAASQTASDRAVDVAALQAENRVLRVLATKDPLTDLLNRRAYEDAALAMIQGAYRRGASVSLLFLDVDRFKSINDTLGHSAGDTVLKELAVVIQSVVRPEDIVARVGGEEFTILLNGTDLSGARVLAERLRSSIAAEPLGPVKATVSIGAAVHQANRSRVEEAELIAERLYRQAEQAMHRAKRTGRNKVCFHDSFGAKDAGQTELLPDFPRQRAWLAERLESLRLPHSGRWRTAVAAALMMILATSAGEDAAGGCMGGVKPDCPPGSSRFDGVCEPVGTQAPDCKTKPVSGCCDYGEEHC